MALRSQAIAIAMSRNLYAIAQELFVFAKRRILKGIADNFTELNNKAKHF